MMDSLLISFTMCIFGSDVKFTDAVGNTYNVIWKRVFAHWKHILNGFETGDLLDCLLLAVGVDGVCFVESEGCAIE